MTKGRTLGHYIDLSGQPAFAGRYLDPQPFDGGVARVASPTDGTVGLIGADGATRLAPRFDAIEPFAHGVARVNLGGGPDRGGVGGGRWGYVAADGAVLVEPRYDSGLDADDERITVGLGGKYGFLDLRGQVVVEPRYDYASWHHEGLAVVAIDGRDGYVDRDGHVVIAPQFDEGTVFRGGVATVKLGGKWGMIDRTGRLVHEPIYDRVGLVKDGACWAVKDGRCCVLTAAGRLGDAWFDEVNQVHERGIWPVRTGDAWHFLLPDGRLVGRYGRALGFHGEHGRVQLDGKWGFATADGEVVVACAFDDAFPMLEGRAAVRTGDAWSYVGADGAAIGPGGFDEAASFQGGRARVRKGDRWGFLAPDGAFAAEPAFDWAGDFGDGRAPVIVADRASVPVSHSGERAGVHVLPAGGLGHPVFAGAGRESHLIAILCLERPLSGPEHLHLLRRITAWERCVHPEGKLYTEDKFVSPTVVYVRVQGLADPVTDVAMLVEDLAGAGFPIVETLFARWGTPPGQQVMQPYADPAMRGAAIRDTFADFPEYWAAVWDLAGPTPAPENYFYLKGALQTQQGGLVLEERHMPLWFPDVRVCMGALQGQGEDYLPANDAAARVEAAVRAAIDRRFGALWAPTGRRAIPAPMVRNGDPGVEPIAYDGRTGYAFAVECADLLHWFSGARMRYREPELMQALREVIHELGLAPVILWQRFQRQIPMLPMGTPTVLVVNLWDR